MTDLGFLPASRLTRMVRRGDIGCLEMLNHFIERVERLNPALNAVVVRDYDRARKRARMLDRTRGEQRGALLGVPMTVKESFDLAGHPSTWGYRDRASHKAAEDALAVQRLEEAGAIVFGKTNVPVSLADWQSYNPVYGATVNPWDVKHTPGGSSGGSAAAIAAGLAGLEIGSDIGGSIRVPAHYCGIFGHKPTWGLLPPRGHSMAGAAAMTDISVIGPLARSAEDLAIALDVLYGPDPAETQLTFRLPAPGNKRLSDLRIAVWPSQAGHATDPETVGLLDDLAKFLRGAGAKVSKTARPVFDPDEAFHVYLKLLYSALSGRATEADLQRTRAAAKKLGASDKSADAVMMRCVDMPHREWLALNERRHQLRRLWGAFFHEWDVLLCPVIATPALPHMQKGETWERRHTVAGQEIAYNDMLFWPGLTAGYHLPASVAPLGMSKAGLPIGVQIVGPLYGDRLTIHVAGLLEKTWRTFESPPHWD
ncbi:MAG: amidase [Proteobacteria bacterium]|nr:amidase [Pseudomonadota bacterium]